MTFQDVEYLAAWLAYMWLGVTVILYCCNKLPAWMFRSRTWDWYKSRNDACSKCRDRAICKQDPQEQP